MDKLSIGIITKPQALKGEFRVKPSISNFKEYKKIQTVFIDDTKYLVEKVTLRDTFIILKLENINTCEQAEMLRNKELFAEIEVKKSNISYIDYEVFVGNVCIGKIVDVSNFGSKDIISIEGVNSIMLPLVDGLILSSENNKVVLSKEIFDQVAVYEN